MHPELIPISVAGEEVLASVAKGIDQEPKDTPIPVANTCPEPSETAGSGEGSEKNLKNT